MTSSEIRASFLDFFREKGHTIVPSSPLLPDAPNLLFTNAGMNQFVPIFLGQTPAPQPPRAADTQKCIRAGGKHNDLEDVGFDTYHHTFFEMLGNWSFGDYFKKKAIAWAWELVVRRWHFPASRIYSTVYQPGPGDPASFDQEAHDHWAAVFTAAGLDPAIHIVNGNKKDNFWMMGDTGPCGPCSELHVDLTPGPRDLDAARQKAGRELVNKGDARCIEIWNLVFIQFNANPDGTFVELPAKHVDTGMGFERVTSMIQGTKGFTDFSENVKISNYETDVFRPIFDELEKLTGKKYGSTLPASAQNETEQEKIDVAFRVIADHIRTLSFSIADGIQPSNEGRGYVLRRILRRAVRYGRTLGLHEPFLEKLVPVLCATMGQTFPEVIVKADLVRKTLTNEEESFFRTLERGIDLFENQAKWQLDWIGRCKEFETKCIQASWDAAQIYQEQKPYSQMLAAPVQASLLVSFGSELSEIFQQNEKPKIIKGLKSVELKGATITGRFAFLLSDTYGFPLDLTELMARERGMAVDVAEFDRLMEEQKARSRAAQEKEIITIEESHVADGIERKQEPFGPLTVKTRICTLGTLNVGYTFNAYNTPFYTEMGGQVSDSGTVEIEGKKFKLQRIRNSEGVVWHDFAERVDSLSTGTEIVLSVDAPRRHKIEAHHSGTHLMNWALRKVLGNTITQKGSYVGPDRLRFDFSHGAAMTPAELAEVERLVNEKIDADVPVKWEERAYTEVKGDPSILQFFGDKYGDTVRVVSIGDFSKELCGGTHVRQSGKVGYFKILHEAAIAAGIRRIEAASGEALRAHLEELLRKQEEQLAVAAGAAALEGPAPAGPRTTGRSSLQQGTAAQRAAATGAAATGAAATGAAATESLPELWQRYKDREKLLHEMAAQRAQHEKEAGKQQEALFQKRAAETAPDLIGAATDINGVPFLAVEIEGAPAAYLPVLADALKTRWQGVTVLATIDQGKVALLCSVSTTWTKKIQAGKIIQAIAPLVGGKGGGRPELAQGGGTNPQGVASALAKAEELVRSAPSS